MSTHNVIFGSNSESVKLYFSMSSKSIIILGLVLILILIRKAIGFFLNLLSYKEYSSLFNGKTFDGCYFQSNNAGLNKKEYDTQNNLVHSSFNALLAKFCPLGILPFRVPPIILY